MPDAEVVELLRQGDEEAFAELMRRYQRPVFGIVYRYLGDYDDAADAAQEAFVRVYTALCRNAGPGGGGFAGGSKLYTWIYRIAVNSALDRLRSRKRRGQHMAESLEQLQEEGAAAAIEARANPGPTPAEAFERRELREILERQLQALPEPYRLVFVLRETRQLSYEEIAEIVETPIGTVKSRLNQARRRLRELLRPYMAEYGF